MQCIKAASDEEYGVLQASVNVAVNFTGSRIILDIEYGKGHGDYLLVNEIFPRKHEKLTAVRLLGRLLSDCTISTTFLVLGLAQTADYIV